ncbi:MAG: glycine--tRNA ligase subunit beta [Betaproteobacteria bacterium]|nr:glycine--tRNA ligase subunit beta [Betaproteobacteria bacterium]
MRASLLVELFTEELPPKALQRLGEAFKDQVASGLIRAQLMDRGELRFVRVFATPRRLAVLIRDVLDKGEDRVEPRKLMPSKVAYGADGKPTGPLMKRLEKEGASTSQLERRNEGSTEYVYLNQTLPGVTLATGLRLALDDAIAKLPIPKVMSYQLADGATTVQFVRPVHGLVALHGDKVVEISLLGLKAGRITHGHRFQGVKDIPVATADAYEEALAAHGKVIASFDDRRDEIKRQLAACASAAAASLGSEPDYEALLDEVTALVEYPTVYAGEFDAAFLAVPQECLVLTMRANQKYFPLFGAAGRLTNRFLIVSNMQLENPKNIIEGNQRVIRPRLEDARFFYNQDRKSRLEERVPQLAKVVYHNQLGNQLERVERIQLLTGNIARGIGADPMLAERAAWLAKADLLTNMVGEFPELQGVMGRYYALHDGEPKEVADAIEQHYRPRFAGDALPEGGVACAVALADKLDALAGLFGIGQQPSGDKDPFGLRRAAVGLIRILVERSYPLALNDLVNAAFAGYAGRVRQAHTDVGMFIFDRFAGYLKDRGYSTLEVDAVLSLNPIRLDLVPSQLQAVREFLALPEAASLAAANKRVANILRQAAAKGESFVNADVQGLREPAERALFDALGQASRAAKLLFKRGDFTGYLKTFAVLKSPVDAFFDSVMVMAEDPELRRNRLALLADLRAEMNRVADISKLAV